MEENTNKKRISMLIRVIVILGLGFFVLDEFYFKNQTPEPTTEDIIAKQMAKKKKRKKTDLPAGENKANEGVVNPENVPSEIVEIKPSEQSIVPETPSEAPVENINVLEKVTTIPEESVDQKLDKIAESTPADKFESNVDPGVVLVDEPGIQPGIEPNDGPIVEPIVESTPKAAREPIRQIPVENTKNTETKSTIEASVAEEIKIPSQGKSNEKESTESGANNMASKIIETLTETPPPAYDQMGRGLVYNCKDKYWACVDRASYVICNKNLKYNESVGKTKECVVQAIYATNDDCAKIQKYNVSVSQSTDFCKN